MIIRDYSGSLMDISEDGKLLFTESSLILPSRLVEENVDQTNPDRIILYESREGFLGRDPGRNTFEFSQGPVETDDGDAFYCHRVTQPKSESLIAFIHGGPHSVCSNEFTHKLYGYLKLGYDLVVPNYRGSLGFGYEYLRKLPRQISKIDVSDCIKSIEFAKENKKYKNIYQIGGSHGGFLGCWLSSLMELNACSIRNPVVNLNSMYSVTDIPDWVIYEVYGKKYKPGYVLNQADLEELRIKSPISNVKNVKTPTLMKIGLKDIRVPKYQGVEWIRGICENVPTKILEYPEDNHPLSRVETETNDFITTHSWFNQYSN